MEHTDTVCTSQETHHVSATDTNRLMLFGETVAVYCGKHTEHTDTVRTSEETQRDQPVNSVWSRCLLREPHKTRKCTG
jgi:hypothetical protein